jgi:hemerythrin-like metal-binding protein
MSYIEWKRTYEVGFKLIDEQHVKLIAIMNELYDAQQRGTGQLIVKEALNQLVDYTVYHFSTEEKLFTQYEYPKTEQHIGEHHDFVTKIQHLKAEAIKGNLLLSLKTMEYLKDWTINHILGTDKEFGEYVKERELGLTD